MTAPHLCPVCQYPHNNAPHCPNCAFDLNEYTFANTRTQKDLIAQHLARWQPEPRVAPTPPVTQAANQAASVNSHSDDAIAVIEYRAAVKMAWADQKLEPFEIKHLQQQANSLKLNPAQIDAIELEIIGRSVREQRYYAALQELSHDFSLTALQAIPSLQQALGLSADLEQQLEQAIFGQTLLEKVLTAAGQPIDHFIVADNGTAIDTRYGLMWCRFSIGQRWQGVAAIGEVTKMSWEEALQSPDLMNSIQFAGFNDWRLPTIDELETLIKPGKSPTIETFIFPNTPDLRFWSSSPDGTYNSLYVSFHYGHVNYSLRSSGLAVRLVRASQ